MRFDLTRARRADFSGAPALISPTEETHFSGAIAPFLFGVFLRSPRSLHCSVHGRTPRRRFIVIGTRALVSAHLFRHDVDKISGPSPPCRRRSFLSPSRLPPSPLGFRRRCRERLGIGERYRREIASAVEHARLIIPLANRKSGGGGSIGYAIAPWRFQLPPNRSHAHRSRESMPLRPSSLSPRFRPLRKGRPVLHVSS